MLPLAGFASHSRRLARKMPAHMDAIAFDWGLSSKAPKPPLDRLRRRGKPTQISPQPMAYLTSENVQYLPDYYLQILRYFLPFSTARCVFVKQKSVFFVIIGFQVIWLLSTQKREKGKLSSGRGINGLWAKACGFMPRKPLYCFPFGGYLCCNR